MSLPNISSVEANTLPENSHDIGDNKPIESNSNCSTDSEANEAPIQIANFQDTNEEIPTFAVRMLNFCREFAIFCLIMITYAALTKDPPKVTKAPAAYPFFPKDSIVTDWYRGEISKAIEHARSSDIAFVMYYAPWDAECQAARKEFEAVARYMSDYITFTAVNCWQPGSECRNQYSKVYRWPVLIAYPSHGRGVQYSGPISSAHMIKFLQKVCNPILRFDKNKPMEFQDGYIVTNLNTSPGNIDFAVLYTTALKYLEKDPLQSISFYVHPQPLSEPLLQLNLWNETLVYPIHERDWRPDDILQWIYASFHQITTWISPSGSKSLVLANSLQIGPTLILFTPKNPLQSNIDYYSMLQQISNEYYNCDSNVLTNMHSNYIQLKRLGHLLQNSNLERTCRKKQDISRRKIVSHLYPKAWANSSSCKEKPLPPDCDLLGHRIRTNLAKSNCIVFSTEESADEEKMCVGNAYKTSILTGGNDPRSPQNLLKLFKKEKCRQFLKAQKLQPAIFEDKTKIEKDEVDITGLASKSNKSLTFIAMDSLLHYPFAENLGIDLTKNADKSAVVIINEKMESHYIMKGPINSVTVKEFIQNFTKNQLPRALDSKATIQAKDTRNLGHKNNMTDKNNIFIEELTTDSFLPTVLREDKAVVVFYYSKQCSFCNGISYVLLTAAKKLSSVDNLEFTRIDGDVNILPWEYTMDSYPTILFSPAYWKSESRVFPSNIPITVPNLIGFILTNLDAGTKLHAMWSICNQTKFQVEKSACFSSMQGETLSLIDETLQDWRKSNKRQKQVLLHKLRQLRQLHLLFAHSPQKYKLIQSYFKKLNSKLGDTKDYYHLSEIRSKDEL